MTHILEWKIALLYISEHTLKFFKDIAYEAFKNAPKFVFESYRVTILGLLAFG
jgi:hypothetical protein